MGSFSSAPKILNDDILDHDVNLPKQISRNELLQHCQRQPKVHPMVKRAFRKVKGPQLNYGLKFRKLNAVTKGKETPMKNITHIRSFLRILGYEKGEIKLFHPICALH